MKKHLLTLAAVATAFSGFAQITLADAYSCLAELPCMKQQSAKCVKSVNNDSNVTLRNVKSASAIDYKGAQQVGNEFIYTVESLPIRNMLVGANNGNEMAVVFAEPAGANNYNVLVLCTDSVEGDYVALYCQTDAAGVNAIKNSNVTMDKDQLLVHLAQAPESNYFISMNH